MRELGLTKEYGLREHLRTARVSLLVLLPTYVIFESEPDVVLINEGITRGIFG